MSYPCKKRGTVLERVESAIVTLACRCFFPRIILIVKNASKPWIWFTRSSVVVAGTAPPPLAHRRQNCVGAMGLGWRSANPHAILDVGGQYGADDAALARYVASLSSSPCRTLGVQVDKAFAARGVRVVTRSSDVESALVPLGWRHLACVILHQHRAWREGEDGGGGGGGGGWLAAPRAIAALMLRSIPYGVARFCWSSYTAVGVLDEYWLDGQLVAFAQSHVKGDVLRGQWFYMRPAGARALIWFHAVRTAVARAATARDVRWVDLGPSAGERFATLKANYGFEVAEDWIKRCSYDGPYATPCSIDELPSLPRILRGNSQGKGSGGKKKASATSAT